jgi:hypothetical protein
MSDYPHITLDIPDREAFAEGASPLPVPHNVVYSTIDVLLGCLAQWRTEAHSQPDEKAWAALMAAYGADRAAESVRRRNEQVERWRRSESEEAH